MAAPGRAEAVTFVEPEGRRPPPRGGVKPEQGSGRFMMTAITYVKGDATSPQADGNKIIAHVCNDVGKWGKGFVLARAGGNLPPVERLRARRRPVRSGWARPLGGQHGRSARGQRQGPAPTQYEALGVGEGQVGVD